MVLHQQMFKGVLFICSVLGHSSQGLRLMASAEGDQRNVVQRDQSHQGLNKIATKVGFRLGPGTDSDWDRERIQTGRFKGSGSEFERWTKLKVYNVNYFVYIICPFSIRDKV